MSSWFSQPGRPCGLTPAAPASQVPRRPCPSGPAELRTGRSAPAQALCRRHLVSPHRPLSHCTPSRQSWAVLSVVPALSLPGSSWLLSYLPCPPHCPPAPLNRVPSHSPLSFGLSGFLRGPPPITVLHLCSLVLSRLLCHPCRLPSARAGSTRVVSGSPPSVCVHVQASRTWEFRPPEL